MSNNKISSIKKIEINQQINNNQFMTTEEIIFKKGKIQSKFRFTQNFAILGSFLFTLECFISCFRLHYKY